MNDFTTEPHAGSVDAVADMLMETPKAPKAKAAPDAGGNQAAPEEDALLAAGDGQTDDDIDDGQEFDDVDAAADDTGAEDEDDNDAGDGDDQQEPQQDLYTVKVDGKEVEVTLDDLKRSFSGQAYIQKGMEEAAQARKQVEAGKAEVEQVYNMLNQERQQLAQVMQQLTTEGVPQPPKKPSKDLLDADPIAYFEQMEAYREGAEQYQHFQQYQQQMTSQQSAAQQRAEMAYLKQQAEALTKVVPEFADPEKGAKLKQELVRTGVEAYGFSQEDLTAIKDMRQVLVLRDAVKYRQLMAQKGQAQEKASAARPMVKPGAARVESDSKTKQRKNAAARMKRNGGVDDVAKFLLT